MNMSRAPHRQGQAIGWAIALAPTVLLLATWTGNSTRSDHLIKSFALPVLTVECAVIAIALIERVKWPRLPLYGGLLVFLFFLHAWLRALVALERPIAVAFTLFLSLHLMFGMAIAGLLRSAVLRPIDITRPFLIGFATFSVLFLGYIVVHYSPERDWVSEIPAFNNIRWLGFYCAAAVGLCAQGWIDRRRALNLVAIFALGLALWTGSRGTLAAVCGGFVAACIFHPACAAGWRRFLLLVLASIILAALLNAVLPLGDQGPQRLLNRDVDSGRVDFWLKALAAIAQRPWLGWGEAQFNHIIQPAIYSHPHNIILQILLAWGIAGFSLLLAMIYLLLRWLRPRFQMAGAPFLFAAANLAAFSLIDGSLFHLQSLAIFSMSLGALTATAVEPHKSGGEKLT